MGCDAEREKNIFHVVVCNVTLDNELLVQNMAVILWRCISEEN